MKDTTLTGALEIVPSAAGWDQPIVLIGGVNLAKAITADFSELVTPDPVTGLPAMKLVVMEAQFKILSVEPNPAREAAARVRQSTATFKPGEKYWLQRR